ncbi:MAG: integrase DNA-binding domain-containing protein [Clostridiales bacterium]|nr:integrase DNA-binding domain-containing protein [Clostridiales bacterium]
MAEKRKDRNGRVLKTGENQRKNGTDEWPMLLRWGSQPC